MLQEKRAEYGKQIVTTLSHQLTVEYGGSFSEKNLRRMMQFANVFPDQEIVVSLIRQLSWTHFLCIIHVAEYLVELPLLKLLRDKLHKAMVSARNRLIASMIGNMDEH